MKSRENTKRKKYGAIDHGLSSFVILGLTFFHILTLGIFVFCFVHFIMNGDPGGWAIIILFLIMWIITDSVLIRQHLFGRLFLNYNFYDDGIHCSGLGWGKFDVPWSSIHTYGFADNSNVGTRFRFFYFSQDPCENMNNSRSMLELRKDRLILQHRVDVWEAVKEYMPADMKRNLEDCLRHNRGGCFRR